MKAVFITYNQAFTEKVQSVLDTLDIRGYTMFPTVWGRGTNEGEPRLGTHTWPELNSSTMTIINDDKVDMLLEKVRKLDSINYEVGIKAFVWNIKKVV